MKQLVLVGCMFAAAMFTSCQDDEAIPGKHVDNMPQSKEEIQLEGLVQISCKVENGSNPTGLGAFRYMVDEQEGNCAVSTTNPVLVKNVKPGASISCLVNDGGDKTFDGWYVNGVKVSTLNRMEYVGIADTDMEITARWN